MKLVLTSLLVVLAASSDVLAHGDGRSMHPREIASRQLEANKRHVVARNCASQIAAYERKRKLARRALKEKRALSFSDVAGTTSALTPHETAIKNTTCVTAPEVTEGPYYLNNDLIRQDLRENQGGILLELDIGVIDTSTCQPLPNALVEIWHCNATGQYSGFSTTSASTGTGGGGNGTAPASMSLDASGSQAMAAPSGGAAPSGNMTGGDAAGGGVGGSSMTDSYNFLRGGWQTNDAGIVTFNTVFPGFYTGRTIHIHTMVHQNISYNSNGTYTSRSGSLVHVGQMFFDDSFANEIVSLAPYSETTMTRQLNAADSILAQENSNGYNAFVDASFLDSSDVSAGVLGFITLGVDTSASGKSVGSYNYYAGGDVYESVTPTSTGGSTVRSGTTTTTRSSTSSAAASSSAARGRFAGLWWMRMLF